MIRVATRPKSWLKRTLSAFQSRNLSSTENTFSIDESGLIFPTKRNIYEDIEKSNKEHSLKTSHSLPLLDHILQIIRLKGPITVSEYMSLCLSHPIHGYYKSLEEKFGEGGDFITAPDISPLFSEMISIFCISIWESLGEPDNLRIVEIGPGRGTMMNEILSTSSSFPAFKKSFEKNIFMIESSPYLQNIQKKTLNNTNITWLTNFDEFINTNIKESYPTIILSQELFDALPIHQFQLNQNKDHWSEIMIDINMNNTDNPLRYILSGIETPASRVLPQHFLNENIEYNPGDTLEISLQGGSLIQKISSFIEQVSGVALIIDYGKLTTTNIKNNLKTNRQNSLRGIRNHQFVDPLTYQGKVDLSVDVNFDWLKYSALQVTQNITVEGTTQGSFLKNLGIDERLYKILQENLSEDEEINLFQGYERLTLPESQDLPGMGEVYKCMGIFSSNITTKPGF